MHVVKNHIKHCSHLAFDDNFRVVSQFKISIAESLKHYYAAPNAWDTCKPYKLSLICTAST